MGVAPHSGSGGLNSTDKETVKNWMVAGHSVQNGKIEGTVPDKGAVKLSVAAGNSISIPLGYHNGSGLVTAGKTDLTKASFSQSGNGVSSSCRIGGSTTWLDLWYSVNANTITITTHIRGYDAQGYHEPEWNKLYRYLTITI